MSGYRFIFLMIAHLNLYGKQPSDSLDKLFHKIESIEKLPKDMLKAISIKETGKPWPWTVCVNGKGYYFQNDTDAIKFVKNALKETDNIDIGCMQINFKHHGKHFKDIQSMFNPENNIKYAAKLLKRLKTISTSWQDAVERYHSFNKDFNQGYRCKVFNIWSTLRANKIKSPNYQKAKFSSLRKKSLKNHFINVFYRKINI